MGLIDDVKGNAAFGLFIGIGAAVLAPVLLPILASIARPVAKGAIKGGIMLYERGRESVAEAGELFEDIVAEVKVEMADEQQAARVSAAAAATQQTTEASAPQAEEMKEGQKERSFVANEEPA